VQGREDTSKVRANGRHLSAGFGGLAFLITPKQMTETCFFNALQVYFSRRQIALGDLLGRRYSRKSDSVSPSPIFSSGPFWSVLINTAIDLHGNVHQLTNSRQPRLVAISRRLAVSDYADDAGKLRATDTPQV
jgi:hypothetical protein